MARTPRTVCIDPALWIAARGLGGLTDRQVRLMIHTQCIAAMNDPDGVAVLHADGRPMSSEEIIETCGFGNRRGNMSALGLLKVSDKFGQTFLKVCPNQSALLLDRNGAGWLETREIGDFDAPKPRRKRRKSARSVSPHTPLLSSHRRTEGVEKGECEGEEARESFEAFWLAYPKRGKKTKGPKEPAYAHWKSLSLTQRRHATLGVSRMMSARDHDPNYYPEARTYLGDGKVGERYYLQFVEDERQADREALVKAKEMKIDVGNPEHLEKLRNAEGATLKRIYRLHLEGVTW